MTKSLRRHLPTDRPYSEPEAAYSLQLDYDAGHEVTISGYAALWKWSRGKVGRFLKRLGAFISYPEPTAKKQNQAGQITIQKPSRKGADRGQIRLIDSKCLHDIADRKRTDVEQKRSRSQSGTSDPNPNPDQIDKKISPSGPPDRRNSSHFSGKVKNLASDIKSAADQILTLRVKNGYNFNPFQWITHKTNHGGHPAAILDVLQSLIKQWDLIEKPWAYADKSFAQKNAKYNEADSIACGMAFKELEKGFIPEFRELWADLVANGKRREVSA